MPRPTPSRATLALLLVLAVALGCARPAAPAAARPAPSAARVVPLGLCEDYPEETRSLEEVERDLDTLASAGVHVLRVSFGWDGVEPEKDRYDLAFWDAFVDLATRRGVRLIPYVAYTPRWNSDGGPSDFWKSPPRDLGELTQLMQLLAERYRGKITSWEIWNEPDNRDYWIGTPEGYAALLAAGARGVRAAVPDAQVVFGGLAGGVEFLAEVFDRHGAARLVDVVNLHSYYETWNPEPIETIPRYVAEVAAIVARNGGRQPIWMAEVGYSNFREGRRVSAWVSSTFDYEHTPAFQAVALARIVTLLFATPAVSLVAWYEVKDPRTTGEVIGDVNNRHLGVLTEDYRPKPALAALSFMARLLSDGFRGVDDALVVTKQPGSDSEVHGFVVEGDTLVLSAWLRSRPQRPPAVSGDRLVADPRREQLRIAAPFQARGPATISDELGNTRATRSLPEGSRIDLPLEVAGGEIQIARIPIAP